MDETLRTHSTLQGSSTLVGYCRASSLPPSLVPILSACLYSLPSQLLLFPLSIPAFPFSYFPSSAFLSLLPSQSLSFQSFPFSLFFRFPSSLRTSPFPHSFSVLTCLYLLSSYSPSLLLFHSLFLSTQPYYLNTPFR